MQPLQNDSPQSLVSEAEISLLDIVNFGWCFFSDAFGSLGPKSLVKCKKRRCKMNAIAIARPHARAQVSARDRALAGLSY